ncbi:MAG: carboxymuconolactone decarboxylase family protein [Pseudomonadota bacterium]
MSDETYEKGQALVDQYNPGMEDALRCRYEDLVPGMSKSVVDFAWGQQYAREGLDIKTRWLITVGALTALGGQTGPQLKVNIAAARKAGATQREIGEAIWQMAIYGGFPAAINGLNAALDVFEAEGDKSDA